LLAAGAALAGCAHAPIPPGAAAAPPPSDSATAALWRFDEPTGLGVADEGRFHLDGTAGLDTQVDFGRFGRARSFTASVNSFVAVPSHASLNPAGAFTLEAWIHPRSFALNEMSTLVSHMTDSGNQRSYVFGLTGQGELPRDRPPHPLFGQDPVLLRAGPGRLWFAFVPAGAWSGLYSFVSVGTVEAGRWTHVAVSYDGRMVRFYLDGRLDSQHAASGWPARIDLPLMVGNYFDPGLLTEFSGDLRVRPGAIISHLYPYEGLLDELRYSQTAREFGGPPAR
jgi:hypothetical protein